LSSKPPAAAHGTRDRARSTRSSTIIGDSATNSLSPESSTGNVDTKAPLCNTEYSLSAQDRSASDTHDAFAQPTVAKLALWKPMAICGNWWPSGTISRRLILLLMPPWPTQALCCAKCNPPTVVGDVCGHLWIFHVHVARERRRVAKVHGEHVPVRRDHQLWLERPAQIRRLLVCHVADDVGMKPLGVAAIRGSGSSHAGSRAAPTPPPGRRGQDLRQGRREACRAQHPTSPLLRQPWPP